MTESKPSPQGNEQQRTAVQSIIRHTRRMIIGVIGSTVVLIGVALLVLPGPGVAIIALGIAILAVEFAWAKRALEKGKFAVDNVRQRFGSNNRKNQQPAAKTPDQKEENS